MNNEKRRLPAIRKCNHASVSTVRRLASHIRAKACLGQRPLGLNYVATKRYENFHFGFALGQFVDHYQVTFLSVHA